MKSKSIKTIKFNEITNDSTTTYSKSYVNFSLIDEYISLSKNINIYLLTSKSDTVSDIYIQNIKDKNMPIFLSGVDFDDAKIFEKIPDNLGKKQDMMIIYDSIVANSIYLFRIFNKSYHQETMYEYLTLSVLVQHTILSQLYSRLYGSSSMDNEKSDKLIIVIALNIFMFLFQNDISNSKLQAIDFLNSVTLLKSNKYSSRVAINTTVNEIINNNSELNSIIDLLYGAGMFQDFMNINDLYSAIKGRYGIEFVKYFFNTLKFKDKRMRVDYYIYKMIVLANSDILYTLKGYRSINRNISKYTRTISSITKKVIQRSAEILNQGA